MMSNRNIDALFQLIHSLEKSEKRNFKLYIKRSSNNEDLKVIELFDAMDKLNDYDETLLLKKLSSIKKPQLSNIKTHLYKQLLASLRLIKSSESIDLQLHEQLDYARILYNKGLYLQSLKILERVKELAITFNQDSFLIQIISLEKKIENLYITRSMHDRAERLTNEALEVNERRQQITMLSNLALHLYSWYIKKGHARIEKDQKDIEQFLHDNLPANAFDLNGFYAKLYLYQSFSWYTFIRQDFLMYYRYTQKWVDLFTVQPNMITVETAHYIKGMHNLLNALYIVKNHEKFELTLNDFKAFALTPVANMYDNNRIQTFVYISAASLNQHIMAGTFKSGLRLIPDIEEKLDLYHSYIDTHRILVFNYKIANLYFGAGDFEKSIDYLNKIINGDLDLRLDLQCYARLLHLLAHYELGNYDLMQYLVKSVYRFMQKMENQTVVEKEMMKFLRESLQKSPSEVKDDFKLFLEKIKKFETSRFETRAFSYFDIVAWIESKVYNKPMSEIITKKCNNRKKRLYTNYQRSE